MLRPLGKGMRPTCSQDSGRRIAFDDLGVAPRRPSRVHGVRPLTPGYFCFSSPTRPPKISMNSSGVRPKVNAPCRRVLGITAVGHAAVFNSTSCWYEVLAVQAPAAAATGGRPRPSPMRRRPTEPARSSAAAKPRGRSFRLTLGAGGAPAKGRRPPVGSGRVCCHRQWPPARPLAPRQWRGWCHRWRCHRWASGAEARRRRDHLRRSLPEDKDTNKTKDEEWTWCAWWVAPRGPEAVRMLGRPLSSTQSALDHLGSCFSGPVHGRNWPGKNEFSSG